MEKEIIVCPLCREVMEVEKGLRVDECIKKGTMRFHSFYPGDNHQPVLREITGGIEEDLAGLDKEAEEIFNK